MPRDRGRFAPDSPMGGVRQDPDEIRTDWEIVRDVAVEVNHVGNEIIGEMGKFAGLSYDRETGASIDLTTAWEYAKEDPAWFAFDWLTVAFPPAKLGLGARGVQAGKGVAGRGLARARSGDKAAAEVLDVGPQTAYGRALGRATGDPQMARAAELAGRGEARTRMGRRFQSGASIDPGYIALAAQEPGVKSPALAAGVVRHGRAKVLAAKAVAEQTVSDVERGTRHFTPAQSERWHQMLQDPDMIPSEQLARLTDELGPEGAEAFQKQWGFRNQLHDRAHAALLLSDEQYSTNLNRYAPHLGKWWDEAVAKSEGRLGAIRKVEQQASSLRAGGRGAEHFKGRVEIDGEALLSPVATADSMARAAHLVANQEFAQTLAQSAVAASDDEVLRHLAGLANDRSARRLFGQSDAVTGRAAQLLHKMERGEVVDPKALDELYEASGWRTLREYAGTTELPDYMARLEPTGLLDRRLDPVAVESLDAMLKFGDEAAGFGGLLAEWNNRGLAAFRLGKTSLNPATHGRNMLGNVTFHHAATGRPKLWPAKGLKELRAQGPMFSKAQAAGILDSSDLEVVRRTLDEIYGGADMADPVGALRGKVGERLKRFVGDANALYRAEDAMWKLDAYMEIHEQLAKQGLKGEVLDSMAASQVMRYMPSFNQNSDIGHQLAKWMPFAGFSTEAARVGKNAMSDRPWIPFFWAHFGDTTSAVTGSLQGYTLQEMEDFKQGLPPYDQDKLLAAVPLRGEGGVPTFLDLEYIIPGASLINESDDAKSFFGLRPFIGSNPYVNLVGAAVSGHESFGGRQLKPRATDAVLGRVAPDLVPESEGARRTIGLAEHALQTAVPPLMPGGNAFRNLAEWTTGAEDQYGEKLEPSFARTFAANVMGLRTVSPSARNLYNNLKYEQKGLVTERSQLWDQWETAEPHMKDYWAERIYNKTVELSKLQGLENPEEYAQAYMEKQSPKHVREDLPAETKRTTSQAAEQAEALGMGDQRFVEKLRKRGGVE